MVKFFPSDCSLEGALQSIAAVEVTSVVVKASWLEKIQQATNLGVNLCPLEIPTGFSQK